MGEDHPKATMARAKQVRSKRKTPENFNLGGKGDLCAKTTENEVKRNTNSTKKKEDHTNPRQKSKITSRHPHKYGSVQLEFHGMPVGRHETLAVSGSPLFCNLFISLLDTAA